MAAVKHLVLADQHRPLAHSEADLSVRNRTGRGRVEFQEEAAAVREGRLPDFPPLGPDHPGVRDWLRTDD
jgi:hypothetical protein